MSARRVTRGRTLVMSVLVTLVLGACDSEESSPSSDNGATSSPSPTESVVAREHEARIVIDEDGFRPRVLRIQASELLRLTFVNKDDEPHSFTIDGEFDSGEVPGSQTRTLIFPTPTEDVEFFCSLHEDERGRIILETG